MHKDYGRARVPGKTQIREQRVEETFGRQTAKQPADVQSKEKNNWSDTIRYRINWLTHKSFFLWL